MRRLHAEQYKKKKDAMITRRDRKIRKKMARDTRRRKQRAEGHREESSPETTPSEGSDGDFDVDQWFGTEDALAGFADVPSLQGPSGGPTSCAPGAGVGSVEEEEEVKEEVPPLGRCSSRGRSSDPLGRSASEAGAAPSEGETAGRSSERPTALPSRGSARPSRRSDSARSSRPAETPSSRDDSRRRSRDTSTGGTSSSQVAPAPIGSTKKVTSTRKPVSVPEREPPSGPSSGKFLIPLSR